MFLAIYDENLLHQMSWASFFAMNFSVEGYLQNHPCICSTIQDQISTIEFGLSMAGLDTQVERMERFLTEFGVKTECPTSTTECNIFGNFLDSHPLFCQNL